MKNPAVYLATHSQIIKFIDEGWEINSYLDRELEDCFVISPNLRFYRADVLKRQARGIHREEIKKAKTLIGLLDSISI